MNKKEEPAEEEKQRSGNREEREIEELLAKIHAMEASGTEDSQLTADLARRGVSTTLLKNAWQQHIEEFPEHGHQQEQIQEFFSQQQDLEERLGDVKTPEQSNPLYDVASRLESGERVGRDDLYNALEQAETYITQRGGVTDKEYQALNNIREQAKDTGYISSDAVESIKKMGRLQIGDDYISNNRNNSLY